jgi:hypothetical protein
LERCRPPAATFVRQTRCEQLQRFQGKDNDMSETKEFSVSTNGDRWSLDTANEPSGGHQTLTALATFLEERAGKPEHAALL